MLPTGLFPGIVNTVNRRGPLDPIRSITINQTVIPKQRAVTYIMQNAWYGILRYINGRRSKTQILARKNNETRFHKGAKQ